MTESDKTFSAFGLFFYVLLVAALCGLVLVSTYVWNTPAFSVALLGPAMLAFAATGLEETVPVALLVTISYFSLILLPTAVLLVRRKWIPALLIFQAVLFVPNLLMFFFVLILSGVQG